MAHKLSHRLYKQSISSAMMKMTVYRFSDEEFNFALLTNVKTRVKMVKSNRLGLLIFSK